MSTHEKEEMLKRAGKPHLLLNGVMLEIFAGIEALPNNINLLGGHAIKYYKLKFGKLPDIPTVLKLMGNSYESFIQVLAKQHQADSKGSF